MTTRGRGKAIKLEGEIVSELAKPSTPSSRSRSRHTTKPKRATIDLQIEDASEGNRPGYRITAYENGNRIGAIVVRQHRWIQGSPFGVEHIYANRLREGIGTRLYKAAADEACRRGSPFMSDMERSPEADGFWRKQEMKGRASKKTTMLVDTEVDFYLVGCPAPPLD